MDTKEQGSAQNTNGGAEGETNNPENQKVSYDTYRRAISDLKKKSEMLAEFSAKAERLEQEKLESSGKLQEALEAVKKKLVDVETKAKAKENMFLYNTLKSRVREHAKELGCINPDALLKLSKFDEIKVGEDYEIDSAQVKVALEKSVQEHPYLFKKEVPAVKDITPGNKIETGNSKELKDMPLEKLTQMLAEQLPR